MIEDGQRVGVALRIIAMAELGVEIDQARANDAKARAEAEKIQKTDKLDTYLTEMALARAIARLKAVEFAQRRKKNR